MELQEIKSLVEQQGTIIHALQQKQDEHFKKYDGLNLDAIKRMADEAIDLQQLKQDVDRMRTAASHVAVTENGEKKEVSEHAVAFKNYLRKGIDTGLAELEQKALSVNSDPDGGYVVTPAMSSKIIKRLFETSPMRSIASIETISTDSLDIIIDDNTGVSGNWVGEVATRSETSTPEIGKLNIPTHEQYAEPRATQKLLDDAAIDMEGWLAGKTSDILTRTENTAFISGNGISKPRGITSYSAWTTNTTATVRGVYERNKLETISSGTSGVIVPDSLIRTSYSLKEEFQPNAKWLANRHTVGELMLLKDGEARYYLLNMDQGGNMTLLGKPIVFANDMPTIAASAVALAYGDFAQGYQIVDRQNIRVLRDPYTAKPFVKFYTTKRVGGDVVNFEAIKLYKLA